MNAEQMQKISHHIGEIKKIGLLSDVIFVFRETNSTRTQLVCSPDVLPSVYMRGLFDFLIDRFREDSKQGRELGVFIFSSKPKS